MRISAGRLPVVRKTNIVDHAEDQIHQVINSLPPNVFMHDYLNLISDFVHPNNNNKRSRNIDQSTITFYFQKKIIAEF